MTPTPSPIPSPLPVAFHVPHLDAGGIERVVVNLLINLDRTRIRPVLICGRRNGSLLEKVPGDIPVLDLGGLPARKAIFALARAVDGCGARILYSGTNAANMTALLAGAVLRGRVLVVPSEHTSPRVFLDTAKHPRLRAWAMRTLYPRAAAVSVPLAEVGQELREVLNLPKLRIMVQPNPVLDARFAELAARDPEIPLPHPDVPLIAATGRLDEAKGFDDLVRAIALLPHSDPAPQLVIMGDGAERPALAALIRELGLEDRVMLTGHVDNPYPVMKRADLAVVSSRREGFGNVLIEAMACGTPVVSTDCPVGPRVILQGGRYGKLVPVGDIPALAAAMAEVLSDGDLANDLAKRGRERAADYGINRTVGLIAEQFVALAAGRPWPEPTNAGGTSHRE